MTEVKNKLALAFKEELNQWAKKESIGTCFYQLFSLKTSEELQDELEYLKTLYDGTDDYFKEDSKDCWFAIWHKSIRQTDYFQDSNCYQDKHMQLLTKEESAEHKFLQHQVAQKGFSKTSGKQDNQLFNDTYNRFLELWGKKRRENEKVSISGKLDSILWNLIYVDKDNKLFDIFVKIFTNDIL